MSHQGRPRLRSALYFTCLRLIRVDQRFSILYQRLQDREKNPLTKMQAVGVLMNKLLHILMGIDQAANPIQTSGRWHSLKPSPVRQSVWIPSLKFMVRLQGTPVFLLEAFDDLVNQHGCPCCLMHIE